MVQTTVAYLAKNEFVWKAHPAFVKAVEDLKKALAATMVDYQPPTASADEALTSKAHTRELLEDLTSEIADQLFALSQETGEMTLAAATDFTRASLDRMSDEELEHTAIEISELASKHIHALAGYLVVAADIADLVTLTHHHVTGDVDRLWDSHAQESLRTACQILRGRLDKLVARHRLSAPDFVAGYHHARLLVDTGAGTNRESVWMNRGMPESSVELTAH